MIDDNILKVEHTDEPLPEAIQNFLKNNPDKKHESLYLCESVDMDGNVIDTKIGVNLLTNYGLKDHFVNGHAYNNERDPLYTYLGSGKTGPIDPTSSKLITYISALGVGTIADIYYTKYPYEYDSNTQIWSVKMKIIKAYWNYTSGSNNEYEIWEIGIGKSQTTLRTHAFIYDEYGQQTCIVKRPNTRLYITTYWTASVSLADIAEFYNDGKYYLISPLLGMPFYGNDLTLYWTMVCRDGRHYNKNGSTWWSSSSNVYDQASYVVTSNTTIVSGDAREAHFIAGPTFSKNKFWEEDIYYFDAWYMGTKSWNNSDQVGLCNTQYFTMLCYDSLSEPEELETYWAYTNKSEQRIWQSNNTYTGNELDDWDLIRIDNNFGKAIQYWRDGSSPKSWTNPSASLPCSQFNITELKLYNHLTHEWDVPVPFKNEPTKQLNDTFWCRVCLQIFVMYKGVGTDVYVFTNMFPHDANGVPIPHIVKFNNSGMVIAATDTFWDPSTYVEIANLSSVEPALQQKRYYCVVSGTNAILDPELATRDEWHRHELRPTIPAYELTDDNNGVLPRIRYYRAYDNFNSGCGNTVKQGGIGSKPLVHNGKGFFFIAYLLAFKNQNDTYTTYNLLVDDKYPGDRFRRYMTRNGDKIVIFGTYYATDLSDPTSYHDVTKSHAFAANTFDIFTITDANTAPTREELTFVWSDSSVVNTSQAFHLYSWSDQGYLVAAKRRTETEFIWVDIYAQGGAQMHLVTNAKHARAIENTSLVVYQDMNLSIDQDYVFQVYDMANDSTRTITINDGSTYTVRGIYGYNDHIYIRMKSSGNIDYTYYYNLDNDSLEKLTWYCEFMLSTPSAQMYSWSSVIRDDYCFVLYSPDIDQPATIVKGIESWDMFNSTNVDATVTKNNIFPCLNEICGGKHLLLTFTGTNDSASPVVDIGLLIDSDEQEVTNVPKGFYKPSDTSLSTTNNPTLLIPFDNGIIRMCATCYSASPSYYTNLSGRMFWFPPEECMRMYMKGTTYQLNSYNAPVSWNVNKKLEWSITNDLSRLLPEVNNGG